jgi:hypothetical protein
MDPGCITESHDDRGCRDTCYTEAAHEEGGEDGEVLFHRDSRGYRVTEGGFPISCPESRAAFHTGTLSRSAIMTAMSEKIVAVAKKG